MVSMYDMIMDFPLFKGIGRDHVSAMLEKTNVYFHRYGAGEKVYSRGELSKRIGFVVRGKIRVNWTDSGEVLSASETLGSGAVIGADSLFGLQTIMECDIVTITSCSIFYISKDEYMALLSDDSIYLMNYLNYLSLRAQQARRAILDNENSSVAGILGRWLRSMTSHRGEDIMFRISIYDLANLCGCTSEECMAQITELEESELISFTDGVIRIPSRLRFLDKD